MRWTSGIVRRGARLLCVAVLLWGGLGCAGRGLGQGSTAPASAPGAGTASGAAPVNAPVAAGGAGPAAPSARFVVVLDAAHGGDDNGGRLNDGSFEKAATLSLSVRLRSLLTARGIQVVTTRESDASLTPEQRAAIANRANAQACVSLHVAETGSGIHLFASDLAPALPARFAPWKTAQAGYLTRSLALTGALNQALTHGGVPVTLGRTALPGIDSMTCPAIALELSPERDAGHKTTAEPDSTEYQARIANLLANALLEWRSEGRQP